MTVTYLISLLLSMTYVVWSPLSTRCPNNHRHMADIRTTTAEIPFSFPLRKKGPLLSDDKFQRLQPHI